MAEDFEARFRSPEAYSLARSALELLEGERVWPTPINYEIWAYVTAEPDSPLAKELARIREKGEAITEDVAEKLASIYLPRQRLSETIRDTGQALSRELASAEQAIRSAQTTSEWPPRSISARRVFLRPTMRSSTRPSPKASNASGLKASRRCATARSTRCSSPHACGRPRRRIRPRWIAPAARPS